jgi:hypothetical protein
MSSWKPASLIQLIVIALLLGVGWLNFRERFDALEQRLTRLEEESKVLAPLSQVMRGFQPGQATPHAYEAMQATGPPDATPPGIDSALAWCPAAEDDGTEWLELRYDPPVVAAQIRIHANFNPGAVLRVLGALGEAQMTELWAGGGTQDALQTFPIASPVELDRLKLELDTSQVAGWNEIDAVALIDAQGAPSWAREANASSVWGKSQPAPPHLPAR